MPLPSVCLSSSLQVVEVMAGDEDALVLAMAERNRGGHRMAVGAGVGRIEQLHGPQVDLAGLHGDRYALLHGQPLARRVASAS